MSPQQGTLLVREVAPRLHSAIPNAVSHVGSEDTRELLQDGLAMAAKMLTRANHKGKKVTAGNVADYTLQHLKSGRRTVGFSSVDVLGSATQLNGRSVVSSIDEDVPLPGEVEGDIPVAELMSRDVEDPATQAARKLDWQEFVASRESVAGEQGFAEEPAADPPAPTGRSPAAVFRHRPACRRPRADRASPGRGSADPPPFRCCARWWC